MNVLILAMSTLPKNPVSKSKAIWDGEDNKQIEIEYYSQLEPITEMLIEQGNVPDEILILCTRKVYDARELLLKNGEVEWNYSENISAIEFYKKRIREYLTNKQCEKNIKFTKIPEDTKNYVDPMLAESKRQAVAEIAQKLLGLKSINQDEEFKVWIDTQGGFRDISLFTNAVISLLRPSDIVPEAIYSLNPEKDNIWNISEQTEMYKIFDFVSGMNEFIEYGRADQLCQYYEAIGIKIPSIIESMKKIADAIMLCDMNAFDKALVEIRKNINQKTDDELLSVFIQQIKKDYGIILAETASVQDIVEWFHKKKLYQQTLTYIESKSLMEWQVNGILHFELNVRKYLENDSKRNKEKLKELEESYPNLYSLSMDDFFSKEPSFLGNVFNAHCGRICFVTERRKDKRNKAIKAILKNKKDEWNGLRKNQPRRDKKGEIIRKGNNKCEWDKNKYEPIFAEKIDEERDYYYTVQSRLASEDSLEVFKLILIYKIIKMERNQFNHMGTQERLKIEVLDQLIDEYVKISRKLYKKLDV